MLIAFRTTTISALKLYEMKSLNESPDPTYSSVNLSIFAIAEVFVGAFTASLPPLRAAIENVLHKFLPSSFTGGSAKNSRNSYALKGSSPRGTRSTKPKHETDDNSERGILPKDAEGTGKGDNAIMKTTLVSVTADDKSINNEHQQDRWV
jgi:hypothetical protein